MTLFLLPLALLVILFGLLAGLGVALVRAVRTAMVLGRAEFQIAPQVARPGEGIRIWARVTSRSGEPVVVRASLACTMFDHRARKLYANVHELTPMFGQPSELVAFATLPRYALRTGAVGAELSNLFSEDAHRLLVAWSVDYEVALASSPSRVLVRSSIPLEVPEGRPLEPDRSYMERLVVDTCRSMHSEIVLNWLVKLAAADGVIHPAERALLHHILRDAHGITTPEAADARIAVEMKRELEVDVTILRKHVPPEARLELYRFLYAMAWRDGSIDGREHNFLVTVLDKFGLDRSVVAQVEREVMQGAARHAMG